MELPTSPLGRTFHLARSLTGLAGVPPAPPLGVWQERLQAADLGSPGHLLRPLYILPCVMIFLLHTSSSHAVAGPYSQI